MIGPLAIAPAAGATLAAFLGEHLPPAPAPLTAAEAVERMLAGCACGNPSVARDKPCASCGCTPVPTRASPAECPRCGSEGRVSVECERDLLRGEIVFVARCHGASARATLPDGRIPLVHDASTTVAVKVSEAISALA